MKHLFISYVCTFLIFIYTLFSYIYVNAFVSEMENQISNINNISGITEVVNNLQDILSEKSFFLNMMLHQEVINEIDKVLIELKSAVKYDDNEKIYSNIQILNSLILNVKKNNNAII